VQVGYRRDQYKRCANLLEAVSQLLEYFAHYQDVPKIQSLTKRLATVQVRAEPIRAGRIGEGLVASSAAGAGGHQHHGPAQLRIDSSSISAVVMSGCLGAGMGLSHQQ
jgi:hypothetical protein